MLKILYIAHNHPPKGDILSSIGGIQRLSMQLVSAIEKVDDVEIKAIINHAPWKWIGWSTAKFLIRLYFRLPGIVKKEMPDMILFSSMVTASLAGMIRKRIGVPMVTLNHGHDVKMKLGVYQKCLPRVFKALDGVISVSSATREACIQRGMRPEKGIVVSNGINFRASTIDIKKEEARSMLEQQLNIKLDNKKVLITVGRQIKRKGHGWFLNEVLPKVKSDVVYLIVGDGPEHRRLKKISESHPMKEHIILLGRQPDEALNNVYVAADLYIMPNVPVKGDMEGFGLVLLEANLAETPAIASDLEGIRDVITDGQNGYKVEAGNADSFAAKIDDVLDEELESLSLRARKWVMSHFGLTKMVGDYIAYLKMVSQSCSAKSGNGRSDIQVSSSTQNKRFKLPK